MTTEQIINRLLKQQQSLINAISAQNFLIRALREHDLQLEAFHVDLLSDSHEYAQIIEENLTIIEQVLSCELEHP